MRAWSSNEKWMATSSMLLKTGKELVYIRQHGPIHIEKLITNTREISVTRVHVPF